MLVTNLNLCFGDLDPVYDYAKPGQRPSDLFLRRIVVHVVPTPSSKVDTALDCKETAQCIPLPWNQPESPRYQRE